MFAPQPPAKTVHVLQAETDAVDGVNFPVRATAVRAPYLAIMSAQPGILAAMDYNNLPQDCRIGIWDSIDDYDVDGTSTHAYPPDSAWTGFNTDRNGMPPGYDRDDAVNDPPFATEGNRDDYQRQVFITRAQAIDAFGAKVAHAIYHEVEQTFPWSLRVYSNTLLAGLFDPEVLYGHVDDVTAGWDLDATPAAIYLRTVDHVPQEAYDAAVSFMGAPATRLEALANIQDNAIQDTGHIVIDTHPEWAIKVADIFYPADRNDWVSRWGCWTATQYWAALARSINIPALSDGKYFAGRNHSTVHFPSENRTWLHSDDVYQTEWCPARGLATAGYYDEWEALVVPAGKLSPDGNRASLRLQLFRGLNFPHPDMVRGYQSGSGFGVNYQLSIFERCLDLPTEQGLWDRVQALVLAEPGAGSPTDTFDYGRIEISAGDQSLAYASTAPWPPGLTESWRGDLKCTAATGEYTVNWGWVGGNWATVNQEYEVPSDDVVQVTQGQTTVVGPPPLVARRKIVIDTSLPTLGAGYELTPDPATGTGGPVSGSGSGTGTVTIYDAVAADYTLVWLDDQAGYNPPADPSEGPLTLAALGTITFGPPTYVLE